MTKNHIIITSMTLMMTLCASVASAQNAAAPTSAAAPFSTETPPTPTETSTAPNHANRINEALAKLPPEKAQMFDTLMRKNVETNRAKQQQLRSLYVDLRNNFVGENFNKDEFIAKSKAARDLQAEIRASLDNDLAEIASKYTQEERRIIFNVLPARYTRDMAEK